MGKVSCEACNKRCKGQAIKLSGDTFYHVKCFTCHECKHQLSSKEFFTRDGLHYCSDDFKKLFAVKCCVCGRSVDGDVITVLNNSFHPDCFSCNNCRVKLSAGDRVTTYDGRQFLCQSCCVQQPDHLDHLEHLEQAVHQSPVHVSPKAPNGSVPPPQTTTTPVRPHQIDVNSPDSDFAPSIPDDRSPLSPVSGTSGYKSDISYDHTDSRGLLSPNTQNFMQYRSTSPVSNASSRKSRDSTGSGGLGRATPDFGKFYKTTYMDLTDGYKRGPAINTDVKPQHFHRPDGFSYRKVRTDILKPTKKAMKSIFSMKQPHVRTEPYKPIKTQEPIQLSKLPDAQKLDSSHMSPIERDDWPAPPAPAAAYPELLRDGRLRRRSGTSDRDVTDSAHIDTADKENERPMSVDPKIDREIEELSKLENSGAAQVILKDLQKKKYEDPVLDPRSASRTPNAAVEPPYKTRYQSPIYASPSRDLDLRQQLPSLDESFPEVKYRTPSPANFLSAPKPGYGLRSYTIDSHSGFMSDTFDGYYTRRPGSSAAVLERTSYYSSQSDIEEYDPTTGLRRNSRLRSTAMSEGRRTPFSSTGHRRSVPNVLLKTEEPSKIYRYEELRLTNKSLPAGIDKNSLEQHLSMEEFEQLFHMTLEEFYHLPEWKRNDLKKRLELF